MPLFASSFTCLLNGFTYCLVDSTGGNKFTAYNNPYWTIPSGIPFKPHFNLLDFAYIGPYSFSLINHLSSEWITKSSLYLLPPLTPNFTRLLFLCLCHVTYLSFVPVVVSCDLPVFCSCVCVMWLTCLLFLYLCHVTYPAFVPVFVSCDLPVFCSCICVM